MTKRDHKLRLFFYRVHTDWLVLTKCVSMCIQYRFRWEINKAAFISKFNPNANSFLASFPNYFARTMTCNQLFASYHSQQTAKFVFDIIFPTVFFNIRTRKQIIIFCSFISQWTIDCIDNIFNMFPFYSAAATTTTKPRAKHRIHK